eukprot:TRINITY_DN37789_c0_g1_i1.p1 TRINITY_DN37789_c0_g1~~TRINITY_DN37789_c0_g1_i1.p1  ORF type:complete len:934 (+),score=146.63 TRINITY_DN37789_c0_g1_i1:129-2930(+)
MHPAPVRVCNGDAAWSAGTVMDEVRVGSRPGARCSEVGLSGSASQSDDEDEHDNNFALLSQRPRLPAEAASVPELIRRGAASAKLIAKLRQSKADLKTKLKGTRSKNADCITEFVRHWHEVDQTKQNLSSSIDALDQEQRHLQSLSKQQDSEQEVVLGRLDEKREHRQDFDQRIGVLMDRLVTLLSTGNDIDAQMPAQINEEIQTSISKLGGKLGNVKGQLDTVREENRKLAIRLSEEQLVTKRLHDEFCKLQGQLFDQKRFSAQENRNGVHPRSGSRGRLGDPRTNAATSSSSKSFARCDEAAGACVAGPRDGVVHSQETRDAGTTSPPPEPVIAAARLEPNCSAALNDPACGGLNRDRAIILETKLREVLDTVSFADPVVRLSVGVYEFGSVRAYLKLDDDDGIFASRDESTYEPIEVFVQSLGKMRGSSRSLLTGVENASSDADVSHLVTTPPPFSAPGTMRAAAVAAVGNEDGEVYQPERHDSAIIATPGSSGTVVATPKKVPGRAQPKGFASSPGSTKGTWNTFRGGGAVSSGGSGGGSHAGPVLAASNGIARLHASSASHGPVTSTTSNPARRNSGGSVGMITGSGPFPELRKGGSGSVHSSLIGPSEGGSRRETPIRGAGRERPSSMGGRIDVSPRRGRINGSPPASAGTHQRSGDGRRGISPESTSHNVGASALPNSGSLKRFAGSSEGPLIPGSSGNSPRSLARQSRGHVSPGPQSANGGRRISNGGGDPSPPRSARVQSQVCGSSHGGSLGLGTGLGVVPAPSVVPSRSLAVTSQLQAMTAPSNTVAPTSRGSSPWRASNHVHSTGLAGGEHGGGGGGDFLSVALTTRHHGAGSADISAGPGGLSPAPSVGCVAARATSSSPTPRRNTAGPSVCGGQAGLPPGHVPTASPPHVRSSTPTPGRGYGRTGSATLPVHRGRNSVWK